MSHLDAEFRKQAVPELHSFVSDQVCDHVVPAFSPFDHPSFKVSKFMVHHVMSASTAQRGRPIF